MFLRDEAGTVARLYQFIAFRCWVFGQLIEPNEGVFLTVIFQIVIRVFHHPEQQFFPGGPLPSILALPGQELGPVPKLGEVPLGLGNNVIKGLIFPVKDDAPPKLTITLANMPPEPHWLNIRLATAPRPMKQKVIHRGGQAQGL